MNPNKEESVKSETASFMLPDGNVIEVCSSLSSVRLKCVAYYNSWKRVIHVLLSLPQIMLTNHKTSKLKAALTPQKVYFLL